MTKTNNEKFNDETERQIRSAGIFFRRKFKKASFGELSVFYTNVVLITIAIIGAGIYLAQLLAMNGQLEQMTAATKATAQAAYAACRSAEISRSTLIEIQRSAIDSHLASVAAYAQAVTAVQNQKTFVDADFTVPGNRLYDRPLSLLLRLKNSGKSDATNVRFSGWIVIAKPNSGATSIKPRDEFLSTLRIASIRVGQEILPEMTGTTKEGNPHGIYVQALNDTGNPFVDTMELDKAIASEHKLTIFEFYTISYEDFAARYVRKVCNFQLFLGADSAPLSSVDFDKKCAAYNSQTEIQKIPLPIPSQPSKAFPLKEVPEIDCKAPTK